MPAPSSGSWSWRLGLALLGAAAVLGMMVVVFRTPPAPPAPPDEPAVPLAELQRLNGVLVWRRDTNRAFSGWVTEQYEGGVLKSRSRVVEGRLEGVSEGWTTGGVLQIREHFVGGVSEGLVTKWHPDGSRLSEGTSRGGRFEGTFRRWHTNGVLAEEQQLVAGQPHGVSRAWFPSGNLKAEATLEHGAVGSQRYWKDGEQPALAATNTKVTGP